MTLLETLMAAALTVTMLALLAQVVVPSLRLVGQSAVRTGLQQGVRSCLDRIEFDLRRSTGFGITVGPGALGIEPQAPGPFTGTPRWESVLIAYGCVGETLWRREWRPGEEPALSVTYPGQRPVACPPSDLVLLWREPRGSTLARHARAFAVTRSEAGVIQVELRVDEPDPATGQTESLQLTRTVHLRSHQL